jgi:hypothetical protein
MSWVLHCEHWNAALNSLLLTKYEPVSTMLHWTHYYLWNMNQCPQCSTQLIITYEIWTSSNVFSADCIVNSGSYFISNNELTAALWTLIITYEIWTNVNNAALNSLLFTKYGPVSTMQHSTHYYSRNMNQCPQCYTQLIIS